MQDDRILEATTLQSRAVLKRGLSSQERISFRMVMERMAEAVRQWETAASTRNIKGAKAAIRRRGDEGNLNYACHQAETGDKGRTTACSPIP